MHLQFRNFQTAHFHLRCQLKVNNIVTKLYRFRASIGSVINTIRVSTIEIEQFSNIKVKLMQKIIIKCTYFWSMIYGVHLTFFKCSTHIQKRKKHFLKISNFELEIYQGRISVRMILAENQEFVPQTALLSIEVANFVSI